MTHLRRNMTKNKCDHIHYTLQFLPRPFTASTTGVCTQHAGTVAC